MADRAVWQRTIVDERGNIIPGAEVTVRSYPGGSLVTLYESPEGAPKSNPFVTGHDGFARFWADSQRVEIVAIGAGSSIRWIVDLLNADEVIGGAVSEATAAAAVAVGEAEAAADRAEAARDAAQLNARIFPDTAAGLAATTDGDYFSVPSPDDDEYLILYRNDNGSAEEVQRYPSAEAVEVVREDVDVVWERSEPLFRPPPNAAQRPLFVTDYSFDLRPLRGYWSDTGLPWLPGGEWDDLFLFSRLEVEGAEIIVTEWSFDLRPLRGYVATTGELWPAIGGGGGGGGDNNPSMEIVISPDQISVYIRQHGTTYVQWRIAHDVVPERNADIWRINGIFEATRGPGGYVQGQEICFDGEHEVAIRLVGNSGLKPDHIGGRVHGNEELTDFYVLLDGVEIDHTVPGRHVCERFEMIQASDMFEPGDTEETVWDPKGPKIMECYKHWMFAPQEGLRLAQRINHIVGGFGVSNSYFGMLCLGWGTRGYNSVHTGAREPYWTREDVSQAGFSQITNSSSHIRAWGDRYSGEVRMTRGWDAPGRNVSIDNRPDRRKIYPDFFDGDTTDTEQPWDVETVLNVTIKEEN